MTPVNMFWKRCIILSYLSWRFESQSASFGNPMPKCLRLHYLLRHRFYCFLSYRCSDALFYVLERCMPFYFSTPSLPKLAWPGCPGAIAGMESSESKCHFTYETFSGTGVKNYRGIPVNYLIISGLEADLHRFVRIPLWRRQA